MIHMDCFQNACNWLENESYIHTIKDFRQKVQELLGDEVAYDVRYLKQQLKNHYGSHISFSEESGKETLMYFSDMASFLVKSKFVEKPVESEDESFDIIRKAAKFIKKEIKNIESESEYYPSKEDITNSWIPKCLRVFLGEFTNSTLKQEFIGQSIAKLASPTHLPPLLFALSVEVDHLFGSRWLSDELYKLGIGVSYSEVTKFKQACVVSESNVLELQSDTLQSGFTQFIADNVDHNIATLDGKGTLHGMGIIAATVCPHSKIQDKSKMIRPKRLISVEELLSDSQGVTIREYIGPLNSQFAKITFKPFVHLMCPFTHSKLMNVDRLWQVEGMCSSSDSPRPNWSGYMQLMTSGDHLPRADISFLPIVDLNPSSYTCVYSTLLFVLDQCKKLNINTPSITFDQPLWLKATEIAAEKSLDVVL